VSGEPKVTPPAVDDVLWAARAYGYPALQGAGVEIAAGEAAWRAAVTEATAPRVWELMHAANLIELSNVEHAQHLDSPAAP
jgi:hypothetical protein